MQTKPFWQSKVLWFNVLSILAYILAWPQLTHLISPEVLGLAVLVVNLGLRLVTDKGLTFTQS